MVDMEVIRRLDNYDVDSLIWVLELNENRLYHGLVLGSVSVMRDDLDGATAYVEALRAPIKSERPDYVSPYEAMLLI